jgi:hypothetical protein
VTDRFVPLSRRADPDAARQFVATLHDGVPTWLRESLWSWVKPLVSARYGGAASYTGLHTELARTVERACQFSIGWSGNDVLAGLTQFRKVVTGDSMLFLDVVEYLSVAVASKAQREALEVLLQEGGSKFRVRLDDGYLENRVLPTVTTSSERAFEQGTAGALLQHAWQAAFARSPNPSDAYRHAVRAVEAASKDVVVPKNDRATLGTITAALRDGRSKFRLSFPVDTTVDPIDVLLGMMQLLWTNQYDRHVTDDAPLHVSQEEAEGAVVLAVTLVQWFSTGQVARR